MRPLSSVNNGSDNSKQFSFTLQFLSHCSVFVYFSDVFTFFLCLFIFSIREYSCNVSQTYLRVQKKNNCCIIFYCIFTLGNNVFLRFSQKNSKIFGGFALGPLEGSQHSPADVLYAFGTFLFCFAKNQCTHIFSVLSHDNNKYMIVLTQITKTETFAFIAVLVFKLLSHKVLVIKRKDNRNC